MTRIRRVASRRMVARGVHWVPVMKVTRTMARDAAIAALIVSALVMLVGPRAALYIVAGWSARTYARPTGAP